MSRNLCSQTCVYCGDEPKLVESPHELTKQEAHVYFEEFEGMIVAKSICPSCEAEYLAWLDESKRKKYRCKKYYSLIEDLSFYSSFNDEPGNNDLPKWEVKVKTITTRIRICKRS